MMRPITTGSVTTAMTRTVPLHTGQRLMSISNTRRSRAIQLIGALGGGSSSVALARVRERLDLTMRRRLGALGANSP